MAGVAKITKEQIWAAAEKLLQEGKSPTLAAVRGVVGGGSYTTISEAMSEFRAVQEKSDAPIKEPLPPVLDEAAARMMAEVWLVATGLANDRLKAEREALDAARLEHERVQSETVEMADQLAEEIEALRLANDSLNEALDASMKDTMDAREELHNERLKVTQLQARLDVLEESMKELRADKERLGRVNEDYAKEMRELDKSNGRLSAEVERLNGVVDDKENWIQGLSTEVEQLRAAVQDKEKLAAEVKQLQTVVASQETEAAKLSAVAAAAEKEAAIMAAKVEQLEAHAKRQEEVFKATIIDYAATHGAAMSGKKPTKSINKGEGKS
jgi:DNA repair exonuclease SbcCD ATPase subunit